MRVCEGRGNTEGPKEQYRCIKCESWKAETAFKHKDGRRTKTCRACQTKHSKGCNRTVKRPTQGPEADYLDDPRPYRNLAAEVIHSAIGDLQGAMPACRGGTEHWKVSKVREWRQQRVQAAQWLSSTASTLFLEALGYNQDAVLERIHWTDYAGEILAEHRSGAYRLPTVTVKHLQHGIWAISGDVERAA